MRSLKLILDAGLVLYGIAAVSAHWHLGGKPAAPVKTIVAPRVPVAFGRTPLPSVVRQVGRVDPHSLPPTREAALR